LVGRVEQPVRHGTEAEVIVRTGDLTWIVSVVEKALDQLAIAPGARVHLIIKARSCHVLGLESGPAKE
jgi:molybdate transport system ATP-binding protein